MNRTVLVVVLSLIFGHAEFSYSQNLNAPSAISSQELLQASTKAWFSIPDAQRLDEKFMETQLGKLAQDEKLAPFMEALKEQFRAWLNEKNVRLGLNVRDVQDVRSGEICIAGILPNQAVGNKKQNLSRGSHGLVLLVDVSQNLTEAEDLLAKLGMDLTDRGASKVPYDDVNGAKVTKWKFPKRSRLKNHRYAYHTITNGWLLSSDNESIFREIVRRLVNIDNVKKGETLAAQPAFQAVMRQVKVDESKPEVRWYVNPFGYIQLAQAIARDEQELNQTDSNDWAGVLQKIGFDGFKAVGGTIRFATTHHEILHRTFVYRPVSPNNVKQKQVFEMFDFSNGKDSKLYPPAFVPETVSSFVRGTWNMQSALKNVGFAIDALTRSQGTFEETLESLKVEMNVDVSNVVGQFDNEIMVVTDTRLPIKEGSELMSVCIQLRPDAEPPYLSKSIGLSWPHQHRIEKFAGLDIIEIDDAIGEDDTELDVEDDPFLDPDEWGEEEEEEAEEPAFNLFEQRFCCVRDDFLFVTNNNDNLKKMLSSDAKHPLAKSADYIRVQESLEQMTDPAKICFRQFSRLDRALRPNYEMMRAGKMAASDTVLARFLNHMFDSRKKDPEDVRKQKIDGSTLPSNFERDVAPYFGPAGWVMENHEDGWLFTGVLLEREEIASQVFKKDETIQRK